MISPRARDLIEALRDLGGWRRPMDIGARDGSYHAGMLARLAEHRLVDRTRRDSHANDRLGAHSVVPLVANPNGRGVVFGASKISPARRGSRDARGSFVYRAAPPRYGDSIVPWIAAWASEAQGRAEQVQIEDGRTLITPPDRLGLGAPLFGQFHTGRVHRALVEKRCQVCGAAFLPGEQRWTVLSPWSWSAADQEVWLKEPPAHTRCLRTSARLCPTLRTKEPYVLEVADYEIRYLPARSDDSMCDCVAQPIFRLTTHTTVLTMAEFFARTNAGEDG